MGVNNNYPFVMTDTTVIIVKVIFFKEIMTST